MNVRIRTVAQLDPADFITIHNCTVTFDETLLQIVCGEETTSFPLVNVISFATSESGAS